MLYKKELLDVEFVQRTIKAKNSYSTRVECQAYIKNFEKSGNILIIDICSSNGLKRRYCTNAMNTITYDYSTREWKNWTFFCACGLDCWGCNGNLDFAKGSEKVISTYLDVKDCRQIEYVLNDIDREKRQKYRFNSQLKKDERIKKYVSSVPELSNDVIDFMNERVFSNYIFIKKTKSNRIYGKCSHCNKSFRLPKDTKHKRAAVCPKCHCKATFHKVQFKSTATEKRKIAVFYLVNDEPMITWWNVEKNYNDNLKPTYDKGLYIVKCFSQFRNKPKTFVFELKPIPFYYGVVWHENKYVDVGEESYVYPDNLDLFFSDNFYNVNLKDVFTRYVNFCAVDKLIKNLATMPQAEYLTKLGLVRIASNIYKNYFNDDNPRLKIDKSMVSFYRDCNVNFAEFKILNNPKFKNITAEQFEMLRKYMRQYAVDYLESILDYMTMTKFLNYTQKQMKITKCSSLRQIAIWQRDYFKMLDELDIPIIKSNKTPKNLKDAHDKLASRLTEIRNKKEEKDFKYAIKKLYTRLMNFSCDGFTIVLPQSRADFIREGQELHHCVGGFSYYENHKKGTNMIFFIRKDTELDKPFVTMEVDMKLQRIKQIYGFNDTTPEVAVREFAKKFVKQLKRKNKKTEVNVA